MYGNLPDGFQAPYKTSVNELPTSAPAIPAHTTYDNFFLKKNAKTYKKVDKIRTAVTLGWSIQGSMIKGPTLFTMTMVLLFWAATASTRASPPCHAVRFLLKKRED